MELVSSCLMNFEKKIFSMFIAVSLFIYSVFRPDDEHKVKSEILKP